MTGKTNTPSTLLPLQDRQNPHQRTVRAEKKRARSTVAAQLQGQINLIGQLVMFQRNMNPYQRLRWLILGNYFKAATANVVMALLAILTVVALVVRYR